ncbi:MULTISPECIES: hypothetical protein [unclassified Streptomyces]|uniref:hypothetical protein n=1 Tax=unclassified Streptomyces TaxID=2593676 RepID=UPI003723248D
MSDNPQIPTSPEPPTTEPPTTEPTAVEAPTTEPTAVEATAAEPKVVEPKAVEPTAVEATAVEPKVVEPTAVEATAVEPTAAESPTVEPLAVESSAVEPSLIKPSAAEPTAAGPTAPLPTAANPKAADPARADLVSADPARADLVSADPARADLVSADSAPADPASTDAMATDAMATDPTAAAPAPLDPAPLDPAPAPKRPRNRRRIAALAATGVLIVAVLAGGGYTVVTVRGADRDAGAPSWSLPKASKGAKAAAVTGLPGMLLPYDGDTYLRGPDMAEFGSDVALSGREATLLRKESVKDLPRSQRRELERQIDRNPVKGMAMRSYVSTNGTPGDQFTMEFVLARMGNARAVRSIAGVQKEFFDALKVFRKGPEIEGFKDSTACFLPPADSEEKLDMMFCSGYVGDVLVTATATAAKPLDKEGAAEMLRAQLDRIKEPGASV